MIKELTTTNTGLRSKSKKAATVIASGAKQNQHLIDLLRKTHNAEWEATPSAHDAITWLNDLVQFLFPSNHLPKQTSYNGILKKIK